MKPATRLALALFALAVLYVAWFAQDKHALAALLVFAAPPAVLGIAAWRGWRRAGFVAGVLALAWFSHGVMVAWTRGGERGHAVIEIMLALAVIMLASVPGLRARFGKRNA